MKRNGCFGQGIRRILLILLMMSMMIPAAQAGDGSQTEWAVMGDVLMSCKSEAETITVPEGIREIAPKAFKGLKKLKTVILPDSLEIIGSEAFADCTNLRKVKLSSGSKLKEIGAKAFLNCGKLKTGFVPEKVKIGKNAFKGTPGESTVTPKPSEKTGDEPTKKPDKKGDDPTKKPDKQGDEPTEDPDNPGDEPTEEPDLPVYHGGGGGGGGTRQPHAPNTQPEGPDYDLIAVEETETGNTGVMDQLTLGGETLALSLKQEGAEKSGFTVSARSWGETPGAAADTLVLTAEETEGKNTWTMNGEVLRRMHKSGIEHLVLQAGDRIAAMETEGFLAGWEYDEMKSRGTASRRFEYEIEMNGEAETQWRVQVEGREYELTEDTHAGIFLTEVYNGPAEALEQPYEEVIQEKNQERGGDTK